VSVDPPLERLFVEGATRVRSMISRRSSSRVESVDRNDPDLRAPHHAGVIHEDGVVDRRQHGLCLARALTDSASATASRSSVC